MRSGQGGPPESAGAAALPACRAGFGWLWLRLALPGFGFRLAFKTSAGFRLDFGWISVRFGFWLSFTEILVVFWLDLI